MIEDDIYRKSSQYRLWSFTEESLQSLRATTNALASDRVRAAQRRAREAHSSTSTPNPSDTDSKPAEEKTVDCLTPEEEQDLVRYYCEQTVELGERYRPPLPTIVRSTAIQYLRRFYLTNSPMAHAPKTIMACALFVATKTENYYLSLRQFAEGLPDITGDEVIAPEFLLMQGLRFTFDVRHPFRGLEGGIMELQAISQGMGQPAPHLLNQTSEDLRRGLLALPPPPSSSSNLSVHDRLGRAHTKTRETLKTSAQMTDAYFLYTPSQIWLSAFLLADKPLAEFYLETKLGRTEEGHPLHDLRMKIFHTLAECSALLSSYKPSASDPEQMKKLKRIAKKRHHCENPEKASFAWKKRVPAAAAASAAGTPGISGLGDGTSESDAERLAKRRKIEGEGSGVEILADRSKEPQLEGRSHQQQQDPAGQAEGGAG